MREGKLRWYGHVMRRDQEYVGRKMMEMELPEKRRRGRPKRRFLDVVKEDMEEVAAKETDVEDRKVWRMMIRYSHPSSSFEGHPLQARYKQDWGRGFILLLPQTAALPGSDAGSDVIKPASSFVVQNRQNSCSMWCPMYRARC